MYSEVRVMAPRGAGVGDWVRGAKIKQHESVVRKQPQDARAAQAQSQRRRPR